MARIFRGLVIGFTALWIAGCAQLSAQDESGAIFSSPEAYLGKRLQLCGYIHFRFEDHNIWPSRSDSLRGVHELGFFADDEMQGRKFDGKLACIKAEIVRTGIGKNSDGEVVVSTAMSAEFGVSLISD
jgi:hypothetical protein